MPEPVLIVHGVANHTAEPFLKSVEELQKQIDPKWKLIPVFWGNLGGKSQDISDCLPILIDGKWTVRAIEDHIPTPIRGDLGHGMLSNKQRATIIVETKPKIAVRRSNSQKNRLLVNVVAEALEETRILQYVDDEDVLSSLHEAVLAASEEINFGSDYNDTPLYSTRGQKENPIRRVIKSIDEMLGKVIGNSLGVLNQKFRSAVVHPFSQFFGDVFVYHGNKDLIQKRIWDVLEEHASGYGTSSKPINAIGHSLGGLILFDSAIRSKDDSKRLFLKSLTTFGSQPAFFHIVDQRTELAVYQKGHKVMLPETIDKWTNLWDAMDVLAFTASTVFKLHNGTSPLDIPVVDPLSSILEEKGWTHSIYWKTEELKHALHQTLVS
ncbi:hypothetical protein [uncultured Pontibacter sp.]|uniref:hypothetical protein n=1 Tax=uncultured Pontibacter sp. TaxID=453356 RepID=UPI00262D0515|nr:hypothetical protein [uncultured Pontibacter sp.]